MRNFLRLAQGIDMQPLMLQIIRQPQLWKPDTYLRGYPQGPEEDVDTIFLRSPPVSGVDLERSGDPHECVWMEGAIHLPAARRMIMSLMASVEGERLGRVMINRIRPGGRIYAHADPPVLSSYWDRMHFVLQGLPGSVFRCGDEQVYMATGEAWFFRSEAEHEVQNASAADRIHMICDIHCSHFEGLQIK